MTERASLADSSVPADVKPVFDAARELFARLGGCALLVGVEDYSAYDASRSLLAGRNDVLLFWKVCRRLGYRNIRLLTTPVIGAERLIQAELELAPELHPAESSADVKRRVEGWLANAVREPLPHVRIDGSPEEAAAILRGFRADVNVVLGEATSSQIVEGAKWLAEMLGIRLRLAWQDWQLEGGASLPGLFTYSGHGSRKGDELVLCPSDTKGSDLTNSLTFSRLRAILDDEKQSAGGHRPSDDLTVFLDCCFAASGEAAGIGRATRRTALTSLPGTAGSSGEGPAARGQIGSRVFCASERDEQARQAMLGGHWHGAFTWAVAVALEQWTLEQDGPFKTSTMSHAELLFRARSLLKALSFSQHPVFVDERSNLPVFHHGRAAGHRTSATPTGKRAGIQMDPGGGDHDYAHYEILDSGGVTLAEVVATRTRDTGASGMDSSREYWKIRGTQLDSSSCTRIKKSVHTWRTTPPFMRIDASFSCGVGWHTLDSAPDPRHDFRQVEGDDGGFYAHLRLENGAWTGDLLWVKAADPQGYLFRSVTESGSDLVARAANGRSCYRVTSIGPLAKGGLYSLLGPTGKYIGHWHSGAQYYYPKYRDTPVALLFRGASGTAGEHFQDGDELRLGSTESSSAFGYIGKFSEDCLYYWDWTDNHTLWTIKRSETSSGPLRTGEKVRLQHHSGRYLSYRGDGYLDLYDSPRDWVVVPAP